MLTFQFFICYRFFMKCFYQIGRTRVQLKVHNSIVHNLLGNSRCSFEILYLFPSRIPLSNFFEMFLSGWTDGRAEIRSTVLLIGHKIDKTCHVSFKISLFLSLKVYQLVKHFCLIINIYSFYKFWLI